MKGINIPRLKVNEEASASVKFRFDISNNMKKVNKIMKDLIDVQQSLNEMSDELVQLEQTYGDNMSKDNLSIIRNMQSNVRKLADLMSRSGDGENDETVTNYTLRLQDNLKQLKAVYLKRNRE